MGFAAAAAQEFDVPAGTAQTRCRWSMRGERSDPPARDGRGRKTCQLLLGNRPPAPEHKSRHARGLGRELQTAGRGEPEPRHFADDGGKALLPQALFHGGQHLALAKGLGVDHAIGMQARIHETGSEQVAAAEAPEHRAFEPSHNPGHEERRGPGELGGRPGVEHLMERSERQPTLRKPLIDGGDREGQGATPVTPAVQAPDAVSQIGKPRLLPDTHAPCPSISRYVMFLVCSCLSQSQSDAESLLIMGRRMFHNFHQNIHDGYYITKGPINSRRLFASDNAWKKGSQSRA